MLTAQLITHSASASTAVPAHRQPRTVGSGFAPAIDISQLLIGLEELNVAMARHPSRANRPTDRRSASMCPNRKNSGCAKNTIMREMSIDAAEAIAISKTVCPVEGMPALLKSGMATILKSVAAHVMTAEKTTMLR